MTRRLLIVPARTLAPLAVTLILPLAPVEAATLAGAKPIGARGGVGAHASTPAKQPETPRAPTVAPLTSAGGEGSEEGEQTGSAESDPLVSNGLGSPLCAGPIEQEALSAKDSRNCATSGFIAAASPTNDFGLDVHIDTGLLDLSTGGLQSAVQDIVIQPVWTALVWLVHGVCVMLEWCFTLDLLDSSAAGGLGSGLRAMQSALTQPWLVSVLSVASVLALYNGLVRRRVAQTVGEAALMMAMIAGGMWAIADPAGTVGALGRWANQASLGTLAVAARGTPRGAAASLGESMQTVFASAIEAPWCYLEFGNVGWCRDTARLDPALRAAGLKIAQGELREAGCASSQTTASDCTGSDPGGAEAAERSARLLREAQTNGAIFLALPPNGPARNSINQEGSLLRTLCGTDDATSCRGAEAPEAEFRTGGATMQRLAGLVFILLGATGMLLLLAFVALRLLGAALFSLLFLLLAPGMVLAPALGDGGRSAFRRWLAQLLGAVVSKLLFSFLLGVLLAVLAIIASLQALGWWTQWLLMSAFWWGAFLRRHHALALAEGTFRASTAGSARVSPRPTLTRRLGGALETRRGWALARWAHTRVNGREGPDPPGPRGKDEEPGSRTSPNGGSAGGSPQQIDPSGIPNGQQAGGGGGWGAPPVLSEAGPGAQTSAAGPPDAPAGAASTESPRGRAPAEGEPAATHADSLPEDRSVAGSPPPASTVEVGDDAPASEGHPRVRPRGVPPMRHMDPPGRDRLDIDRELEQQRREVDSAPPRRPQEHGEASAEGAGREPAAADPDADPAEESSVMRDVREVLAGRKRQLGHGRP
jgi:hypothetical protein